MGLGVTNDTGITHAFRVSFHILVITDGDIAGLTDTLFPSVSAAKSRANEKLFKAKGAPSLKMNLLGLVCRPINVIQNSL